MTQYESIGFMEGDSMFDLDKVKQYLNKHELVSAAYLFGSFAQGKQRSDSDVDIAILFIPGVSQLMRFDTGLQIACALEDIVLRKVDIVDLLEAGLFLSYQIKAKGVLLLEKDHAYRVNYEVRSLREYFDFTYRLERIQNAALERL